MSKSSEHLEDDPLVSLRPRNISFSTKSVSGLLTLTSGREFTGIESVRVQQCDIGSFIVVVIQASLKPLGVAQYHGTSLEMIQRNYCGVLEIGTPNLPVIEIGRKRA